MSSSNDELNQSLLLSSIRVDPDSTPDRAFDDNILSTGRNELKSQREREASKQKRHLAYQKVQSERSQQELSKCKSIVISNEEANLRKHSSQ